MQRDRQHLPENARLPLADQVGSGHVPNRHIGSLFGQNVDFQPSKICPRNFIIFDRTDNHSQIMYHPATAAGFGYPREVRTGDMDDPRQVDSFVKEDSADIDLLLSFEDEDGEEEYDEEELSTARTQGNDASDTADSCSTRSRNGRRVLSSLSSASRKSNCSERKRKKMRKMVDSLRGIVPGGDGMSTVAVLDEAVKYLKSLKVELEKVGVGSLKN